MLRVAAIATMLSSMFVTSAFAQAPSRYTSSGCAACHGADGEGTALGPAVATGALDLTEFIAYLRAPTGTMPAYPADAISEEAAGELFAYLTRLAPAVTPAGTVEVGAALYRNTGCYECHADEGQGGAQGPRIGPDPVSYPRFTWYVRYPSGAMPPYTEAVISDQDLADIHAFLEARPRPPDVSSIPLLAPWQPGQRNE